MNGDTGLIAEQVYVERTRDFLRSPFRRKTVDASKHSRSFAVLHSCVYCDAKVKHAVHHVPGTGED